MSAWEPWRRSSRRRARNGTGANMVLNLDLNAPPVESWLPEGASGSSHPCVSQEAAVPVHPQRSTPTREHQGVVPSNNGLIIDVDALDDEAEAERLACVKMSCELKSCLWIQCAKDCMTLNGARRNQFAMVVLDEDLESNPIQSGFTIMEPATTLPLNIHNKRERIPADRTIINCDLYPDLEEENNAKRRAIVKPEPEPEKVVPKEPTFTCPICMNPLVEASSTICGHIFCQSCIKASIKAQKKCPTCRRKLTRNNFHRVYLPTTS